MREAGKPVSAGDVTKVLDADCKEVARALSRLSCHRKRNRFNQNVRESK